MFKCKECGYEYKEKPEFCECGNNEFEEFEVEFQDEQKKSSSKISAVKPIPLRQVVEPYAIVIFVFCIILSFFVLFFVGNSKGQQIEKPEPEVAHKQIPSIDKLWNSSTKGIEKYNKHKNAIPVPSEVQKVEENLSKTTLKRVPTENIQKPKAVNKPRKIETKRIPTPIPEQPKVIPSQKSSVPKTTVTNIQELNNYKIQLRNRIASKIDFTQVIGDGSCIISFTISSEGALTNRKFLKQSDNDTLNDVVFNAMLATPSFRKPPAGYKGENLKLGVKIYGGQFEVSLN